MHALRQVNVNISVFCSGVAKPCKYQGFALQHAKNICFVEVAI